MEPCAAAKPAAGRWTQFPLAEPDLGRSGGGPGDLGLSGARGDPGRVAAAFAGCLAKRLSLAAKRPVLGWAPGIRALSHMADRRLGFTHFRIPGGESNPGYGCLAGAGHGVVQRELPGVHSDAQLFEWITNGYLGTAMPAFRDSLSEEQRWHVINYIRTLAGP